MFKILKKDNKTKARLGILSTPHGIIKTPSYVIVATHAQIKCLKPSDIKKTKTQVVICNTYHLWDETMKHQARNTNHEREHTKYGTQTFILNKLVTKIPTMTDSGGFQVFSLGFGQENKVGKILTTSQVVSPQIIHRKNVKITAKGVYFLLEGRRRFLGPELSMKIQQKLGADIIFAFDECTSPLDGFEYNKKAMERTHKWAMRCLKTHNPPIRQDFDDELSRTAQSPEFIEGQPITKNRQFLFGIVQGGKYKSLRQKSAKFIASLPFDGIGIGGSFGKNEMVKTLKWVIPYLPEEKPRHLLGIGKVEDIFNAVENGIDLFDFLIPTREARHGRIYTPNGYYDIRKQVYSKDDSRLEKNCKCPTCKNLTRNNINKLFKTKLLKAQQYTTIHNIYFFNDLLEKIRNSIAKNKFREFKKKTLTRLKI